MLRVTGVSIGIAMLPKRAFVDEELNVVFVLEIVRALL